MNDFATARRAMISVVAVFAALAVGCSAPAAAPPKTTTTGGQGHAHTHNASDHNHPRGKMLMASDGKIAALLTAHLSSKDGNELDVFVEQKGEPHALTAATLTAEAVIGGGERRSLTFACAPANERPFAEPDGMCSHYVATAPWMRSGDVLRVDASLPVGDSRVAMVWRDFEPKKYAHHED